MRAYDQSQPFCDSFIRNTAGGGHWAGAGEGDNKKLPVRDVSSPIAIFMLRGISKGPRHRSFIALLRKLGGKIAKLRFVIVPLL
jgi:hypothetical protein